MEQTSSGKDVLFSFAVWGMANRIKPVGGLRGPALSPVAGAVRLPPPKAPFAAKAPFNKLKGAIFGAANCTLVCMRVCSDNMFCISRSKLLSFP